MSAGEVVPFDWTRMFLGDVPPLFLLEIVFRTAVIFLWLIFLLRFTGKRGLAQLSPLELAIVIGLGSAAGDPMFYPEVPLLHAMLVLALVVGLQRLLAVLVICSEGVETLIEGLPVELVRDGVLVADALRRSSLSRDDLFERLRAGGVRQLGEVQRVYFEQDGNLSVFRHAGDPPPGLPIVPPWDLEPPLPLPVDTPHVALRHPPAGQRPPARLPDLWPRHLDPRDRRSAGRGWRAGRRAGRAGQRTQVRRAEVGPRGGKEGGVRPLLVTSGEGLDILAGLWTPRLLTPTRPPPSSGRRLDGRPRRRFLL